MGLYTKIIAIGSIQIVHFAVTFLSVNCAEIPNLHLLGTFRAYKLFPSLSCVRYRVASVFAI